MGDGQSRELALLRLIDRFGLKTITGRETLGAGEVIRMLTAENVYKAKIQNLHSDNWAEWARENKDLAKLLAEVEKMING